MNRRQYLFRCAAAVTACALPSSLAAGLMSEKDVRAFIRRMRDKHQFGEAELNAFFSALTIDDKFLKLTGAPTDKPRPKIYWRDYKKNRLTGKNIAAGAAYSREHAAPLARAEEIHGVPAAVIVAIIGVETRYGEFVGRHQVAAALATLAFRHPTRAAEFREELAHLLLHARESRIDPLGLTGSYAGAFGAPQFLPSSARRYALDFNGDGKTDLFDHIDAIGSVGNFLRQHGWQRKGKISYPARVVGDTDAIVAAVAKNDYKAVFSRRQLSDMGVLFDGPGGEARYLLVNLENRYDTEYRVGGVNFYALTRYNKSFKYAAVVADLAVAIGDAA